MKGSSDPSINTTQGDSNDIMFMDVGTAAQHVKAGKLKIWAVSTKERNPAFPQTPTLAEGALPGFDMYSWNGILARKGTPTLMVSALSNAAQTVWSKPDFRKDQLERGNIPWGSTPQELDELLKENAGAAKQLIEQRNIRLN